MSAFSAGGIFGSLGLDLSGFTSGMLTAEGLSELFPAVVTDFIASPILGIVDIAKEAGESVIELGTELKDVFFEIGEAAGKAELAAEKAGVSIEYFTTLAAVGKTVNVTADDLSAGLRFLNRNIEGVIDGTLPRAAAGFQKLGISMDWLKEHQGDTQAVTEAVRHGLDGLSDAAERTSVSMAILGRGGESILPLMTLGPKFDELAGLAKSLGATEDEEAGKAGRSLLELEAVVEWAWEGIEKAFATPILDYLSKNMGEIIPIVEHFAAELRGVGAELAGKIMTGIQWVIDHWPKIEALIDQAIYDLETWLPKAFDEASKAAAKMWPYVLMTADFIEGMGDSSDSSGKKMTAAFHDGQYWMGALRDTARDASGAFLIVAQAILDIAYAVTFAIGAITALADLLTLNLSSSIDAANTHIHELRDGIGALHDELRKDYDDLHSDASGAIKDGSNTLGSIAADAAPPPGAATQPSQQPSPDSAAPPQGGNITLNMPKVVVSEIGVDLDKIREAVAKGMSGPLREAALHRLRDISIAVRTAAVKAAVGGSS